MNKKNYMNSKYDIDKYITKHVESVIYNKELVKNNDKLVVAVSGGPDSMCLLNVLINLKETFSKEYNINYDLVVAHVNHMVRCESEFEKEYVEKFCQNYKIPFYYLKENIKELSKKIKISEEMCGRNIRYEFFEKIRLETNSTSIAVAHNQDDNVETILLNIIRGTGLKGLTGIDYKFKNIIRPLLDIEKKDILEYNNIHSLNPCFDYTNNENVYLRNKVRNILIPMLKEEYNSNVDKNIIRMKDILSSEENFLEDFANNILSRCIIYKDDEIIKFEYKELQNEHICIKSRVIRKIIELKLGNLDGIENKHVNDILKLIENNIKGKKYIIGKKFKIEVISKNTASIY